MKFKYYSLFLIIAALYVGYRTYNVYDNIKIIKSGLEINAKVNSHNPLNNSITYTYTLNGSEYLKSEEVNDSLYKNTAKGDIIKICIDSNNKSIIKDNKLAKSFISLDTKNKNPIRVPIWLGFSTSVILLIFGTIKLLRNLKK